MYKTWVHYDDGNILCKLEQVPHGDDLHLFVHASIKKYNKAVKKKCKEVFKSVREYADKHYDTGVCAYYEHGLKWPSIVDNTFKHIGDIKSGGKEYKVIQWL